MGIPDGCCNINIQVNVKAGKVAVTADRGGMGMSSGDSASCSPAAARLPSSPESSSTLPKVSLESAKTKAVKKEPCAKKLDFDATTKCETSGLDKVRGFLQARRAQLWCGSRHQSVRGSCRHSPPQPPLAAAQAVGCNNFMHSCPIHHA